MTVQELINIATDIIFGYPFVMSFVWMLGAINFLIYSERKFPGPEYLPTLEKYPSVSVVLPCYNESENIRETIAHLVQSNYPDFEIVAVNDGSRDDTASILEELATIYPQLRVVHLKYNSGKANAQRMGTLMSNGDIVVCMDGDALFEPNAITWLVRRLMLHNSVGGVTGNPRIRNRTSLLGKIQVGEFSSIIGLIKRSQMNISRIFTVSGVICAFKKAALHDVGYWRTDMITDDIDITWRLQKRGWLVFYQPNAICWILMPETLKGLWKQRLRWAQGGAEVAKIYGWRTLTKSGVAMTPLLFDYLASIIWANIVVLISTLYFLDLFFGTQYNINLIIPSHWGLTLSITFLIQVFLSLNIDKKYEAGIIKYLWWQIWYPFAFWLLSVMTSFVGFYKVVFTKQKKFAVWTSPDRGLR